MIRSASREPPECAFVPRWMKISGLAARNSGVTRINSAGAAEICKYLRKTLGNQLIHQDAAVLRIVPELDDVEIAVIRFQQVGLSPAAHLADMPAGGERHGKNAVP